MRMVSALGVFCGIILLRIPLAAVALRDLEAMEARAEALWGVEEAGRGYPSGGVFRRECSRPLAPQP
jgi:hypothetical protein